MLHDKQLSNKIPIQSTKNRKTELCVWTTSKLLEMCIVPHVQTKNVFAFQPIKRIVSTTVKKCEACCHFLNIPFKDQKPTIMLFAGDGTHCLHESRLRITVSFFVEISPPITISSTQKGKIESKYGIIVFVSFLLMI